MMACYGIALKEVVSDLVRFFRLWPTKVDPVTLVTRSVHIGIDESTIVGLLVGPLFESLLLVGVIELLRRLKFGSALQIITSALLLCASHSISLPIWGVLAAPSFLIQSGSYVYWRRWRGASFWSAAAIVYILHFCINITGFLIVLRRTLNSLGF
jgi:hypothetical protein